MDEQNLVSHLYKEKVVAERDLLMGADAIADFLGVTRRQVYRLVYDGIIPSFKLGGTVAARRSSLTRWMEQLEKN